MSDFPHDIDLEAFWDQDSTGKVEQPPPGEYLIAVLTGPYRRQLLEQLARLPPDHSPFKEQP